MGESLLVQTHPLGFTGDTNPFNPLSVCIEIHHASTWHGPLVTHTKKWHPKQQLAVGRAWQPNSSFLTAPLLWAAHKSTAPFSSLGLGPLLSGTRFQKNITSLAGGLCCTTARIPDRFYVCTLILLNASSLKLSQTHSPKSLRSKTLYGLATQKFLLDLRVGRSWCFKQERLMAPCLWTSRHLPICIGNQASTKVLGSSELL